MNRKPVRSMTGFARVRINVDEGEFTLTVKSVNHRGLDIRFHMSADLDPFENSLRAVVKQHVLRGHVEVRIAFNRSRSAASVTWNRPLMEAYVLGLKQASAIYGVHAEADLNAAFQVPGMLADDLGRELNPALEGILAKALGETLDTLNQFREREGGELAALMRERDAAVVAAAGKMEEIRALALPAFHERLAGRLGELMKGFAMDPQRLAQEAAVLADRSDIGEEIARLRIHAAQLDKLIEAGGEIGKKMDFLLQEMNREANTVLSKTTGIGELGLGMTELALAVKSDIEKIREQSLNVE
ncbi:MAG: YicC/YloC family endoribonuclease [Bryobacterales bacterium]|nr:YicC/YloC family endoribonuclease [Bryobacterales bacterium]